MSGSSTTRGATGVAHRKAWEPSSEVLQRRQTTSGPRGSNRIYTRGQRHTRGFARTCSKRARRNPRVKRAPASVLTDTNEAGHTCRQRQPQQARWGVSLLLPSFLVADASSAHDIHGRDVLSVMLRRTRFLLSACPFCSVPVDPKEDVHSAVVHSHSVRRLLAQRAGFHSASVFEIVVVAGFKQGGQEFLQRRQRP